MTKSSKKLPRIYLDPGPKWFVAIFPSDCKRVSFGLDSTKGRAGINGASKERIANYRSRHKDDPKSTRTAGGLSYFFTWRKKKLDLSKRQRVDVNGRTFLYIPSNAPKKCPFPSTKRSSSKKR